MEIYHGSYTIIEQPKLMDGRYTKDLGLYQRLTTTTVQCITKIPVINMHLIKQARCCNQ